MIMQNINMKTIHLQLIVEPSYISGIWQVTDNNYEPGMPQGLGSTIPDALDDYLQQAEEHYCEEWDYDSFTWEWIGFNIDLGNPNSHIDRSIVYVFNNVVKNNHKDMVAFADSSLGDAQNEINKMTGKWRIHTINKVPSDIGFKTNW